MAEQSGPTVQAAQAGQVILAARRTAARATDRAVAETLAGAHAGAVDGAAKLDAIAAELDHRVRDQAVLGVDTALGAREFRKFLVRKHHEIIAVIGDAQRDAAARTGQLRSLAERYPTD